MENPLLHQGPLPNFSKIIPEYIEPAVKQVIQQNRHELAEILAQTEKFTWHNLMVSLEEMEDRLARVWSSVSHMHAVVESENLRQAYNASLPWVTEYHTELLQNETLYRAIQSIADSDEFNYFNKAQRKVIENELRDFKLAGVHLSPETKARFAELMKQLSKLSTQFAENVLDATHAWTLHITDQKSLAGLPEQTLKIAESDAAQRGLTGWIFTLEFPSYSAVMKYLKDRELRRLMYEAYTTRASDQGPDAGRFDNSSVMNDILKVRHELAKLVGFPNFAEYSLTTKMAKTPERVLNFLNDLVKRSKAAGEKDIAELTEFAKAQDNLSQLEAWDLAYYSEKLRQKKFDVSQEELRVYFPAEQVLSGMFSVVNQLFGVTIKERQHVDVWHPQVKFFDVFDEKNNLRGSFYIDLYARPNKRDGAWMDDCRIRRRLSDGTIQYPVAFLTCNFTRPVGDQPALLTHEEVLTLFHEFGHTLHHLMTQVDYASVSGINGVPWDAVEFPSQFLEYWCWEKEVMKLISRHFETGETLPDALFKKMIAAKYFQPGMHMLRQLEFALFDFRLHLEYDANTKDLVQTILDEVRQQVSVISFAKFNRFQHGFSHIFAGGYAAGYYSYKWAEVLSADAFSRFEETGILNHAAGVSFLQNILEQGGVVDPMEAFIQFRGREPKIDALLKYSGLS